MQAVRGSYCGRPRRSIRLLCLSYLIGSIFLTLVGHAAPVVFAAGAVWYVKPTGSDSNPCQTPTTPCKTINGAFSKAISSGDTVSIAAGTYTENIIIPPGLTSVTLLGAGAALTILDGNNAGSVVMASSGTALSVSGMTIQHGKAAAGGGISATTVTISNSIFTNNSASFAGGGIVALGTAQSATAPSPTMLLHNLVAALAPTF